MAFLLLVLRYDISWQAVSFMGLFVLLLIMSLVDLDTGCLPDGLQLAGTLWFVLMSVVQGGEIRGRLCAGLMGGLSVSIPLFILVLILDRVMK